MPILLSQDVVTVMNYPTWSENDLSVRFGDGDCISYFLILRQNNVTKADYGM